MAKGFAMYKLNEQKKNSGKEQLDIFYKYVEGMYLKSGDFVYGYIVILKMYVFFICRDRY